jgi:hypothetical protein
MGREENLSQNSEKTLDVSIVKSDKSVDKSQSADMNYKTELCRTWVEKNYCPYKEKCRFAHGKKDLHEKSINSKHYKQKECNSFYKKGFCPYGPRCHFKHEERKLDDISRPYYQLLLKSSINLEKILKRNVDYSGSVNDKDELLNTRNPEMCNAYFPIGGLSNLNSNDRTSFHKFCHDIEFDHREMKNVRTLPVFQKIKNNNAPSPVFSTKTFSHNNKHSRKFTLHKNILNSFM